MIRLSIDPGRDTGWCTWSDDGRILACGLGAPKWSADVAIIEKPQVYRATHSKGDPNDLITLAVMVGRYIERLEVSGARVVTVVPRDWKGTVEPNVFCARIVRDLSAENAATVISGLQGVAKGKHHNVIDAVGLGAWAFRARKWPSHTGP